MQGGDRLLRMVQTGVLAITGGFVLLGAEIYGPSPASTVSPATLVHLLLLDRLDRLEDSHCVDIPGTSRNMLVDVPLFAHNCKTS
jgi:hypothetical protein